MGASIYPFYWYKQQIKITHLREKFLYGRFCERKNGKFALKLGCRLNGYNFDKGKVAFPISEEVKVVDVLFVKISWLHWSPWHRVFDIFRMWMNISTWWLSNNQLLAEPFRTVDIIFPFATLRLPKNQSAYRELTWKMEKGW